jgi:hypothetical protein
MAERFAREAFGHHAPDALARAGDDRHTSIE